MKIIQWDDKIELGIKEIDDQHRSFVEILNQLYEATMFDKANDIISEVIVRLLEYAELNFKTEEDYFKKFDYGGAEEHENFHKDFLKQMLAFKKEHEKFNQMDLAWQLLEFLENWLVDHLENEDRGYVECFKKNGLL